MPMQATGKTGKDWLVGGIMRFKEQYAQLHYMNNLPMISISEVRRN